jgi:general secretion pathway protein C
MFCSECLPPETDGKPPADGDEVPLTKLPIQLVATSLSEQKEESYATVRNVESGAQGAFWVGDRLPGGGPIDKIAGTYVHFENPDSKRMEKVSLLAAVKPKAVAKSGAKGSNKSAKNKYTDNVRKVSDTSYEVERGMIDQLISNPTSIKGARMRPYQKNGEMKGFQMFAVRKDSLFNAIGLKSGDAITSINGYDLSSPDKVLEAYAKVKDLDKVALNVVRRGKDVTFTYQAR